ncbi:G-protein coupled receptor Mth2-like [Nylanderia fulva]|uniref:G-protein coupled receptor Mth2-like n=1 Tax=Nylanderia fulva TaxID=613905 RepID=UPI0010FB186A|nr:G-protein coupled receptor Mth2-like [Nylanderia fulva]
MSNKVFEDFNKYNNESNVIPYEMCHNNTCILLCCPLGYSMRLNDNKCIPQEIKYVFPNVYEYINNSIQNKNKRVDEFFQLAVHDSCLETLRVMVDEGHEHDYKIFTNGSIYLSYYKTLFKSTSYCLGVFLERGNKFEVSFCSEILDEVIKNAMDTPEVRSVFRAFKIYAGSQIVCILFLFAIFLVYSILPELRHVHGFLLRNYSAVATIATIVNIAKVMHFKTEIPYPVCITLAFLEYFFLMSGFFWLSAMSFNIWWTFRSFCSLQENIRQSEKKKLMYYVIFAYGGPFILAIVCVIVIDFVSEYLPINLRPEFKLGNCWYFGERKEAFVLYFYGMKSVCIISTICLFISTVLKVRRYEKDTGFCLTDSKSERYNDYKKWFNLYMKLFIVMFIAMGINWIVLTMSWLFEKLITYYLFYVTALLDVVQSFCIFIIFVWNKKIKLMLLKRFGFKTNVSNIEHLTITSEVSMQEKRSSSAQENYYTKDLSVGIKL